MKQLIMKQYGFFCIFFKNNIHKLYMSCFNEINFLKSQQFFKVITIQLRLNKRNIKLLNRK